jgi:hypothetical protein
MTSSFEVLLYAFRMPFTRRRRHLIRCTFELDLTPWRTKKAHVLTRLIAIEGTTRCKFQLPAISDLCSQSRRENKTQVYSVTVI